MMANSSWAFTTRQRQKKASSDNENMTIQVNTHTVSNSTDVYQHHCRPQQEYCARGWLTKTRYRYGLVITPCYSANGPRASLVASCATNTHKRRHSHSSGLWADDQVCSSPSLASPPVGDSANERDAIHQPRHHRRIFVSFRPACLSLFIFRRQDRRRRRADTVLLAGAAQGVDPSLPNIPGG